MLRRLGACWAGCVPSCRRGRQAEGGVRRRQSRPPRRKTAAAAARPRQEGAGQARRLGKNGKTEEAAHPRRRRSAGCCIYLVLAGLVGAARRRGAFVYLYQTIDDARTPTPTSRPRPPSSTTTTARPSSASTPSRTATRSRYDEMPQDIKDAVVAAENRTFWTDKRHRPQGHRAGGVQQRARQRHPGRVDDHPAVRQDPLPHPGALLHAQGQGGDPLAQAAAASRASRRSSRATSTPSTSAAAPTASRRPRRPTSTRRQGPDPARERGAGAACINNPTHFDPANGKDAEGACASATSYVLDGMAATGEITADEAEKAAASGCRSSPKIEAETAYGGQKGHMLDDGEDERSCSTRLGLHRARRSTAAACGSPRRSPRRR